MQASEFVRLVRGGQVDAVEHTHKVLEKCRQLDKEFGYFNAISEELALRQAEAVKKNASGRLAGLPVSVKDCICVKGVESRAGSRILTGYMPRFNATAVQRLADEGAVIIGKTAQDEFGFGSFSTNPGLGLRIPKNPFDKARVCGGSSGGSAGIAQKADFPHISLGESTGGSIAAPASFCGVAGLCPTYGRVSRYGLIDYANSLDKIGPIAKSAADCALALEIAAGPDERDSTSIDEPADRYTDWLEPQKGTRIGIIKEHFRGADEEVRKLVWDTVYRLEDTGIKYDEVSLPLTAKYSVPAYYLIAMAESSTNLAKYCGMRYGATETMQGGFNEFFSRVRAHNFGPEAKRRIILGTFARMAGYRDAYYMRALRVRTMIIQEYRQLFKRYQALIGPTMPVPAPKIADVQRLTPLQSYMMDMMTAGPNLAGLPHISVNAGFSQGLPAGMLITGDHLQEKRILQIAGVVQ